MSSASVAATTKSTPWTSLALVLLTIVVFLVAAVPGRELSPEEAELERARIEARFAVEEFRAAIQEYALDHGQPPGAAPSETGALVSGPKSSVWLTRQLIMNSDQSGMTVPQDLPTHPFGPYLWEIPPNPLNGLADILVLEPGASFPADADGSTGWIFDPGTGEVRLNAVGLIDEGLVAYDI